MIKNKVKALICGAAAVTSLGAVGSIPAFAFDSTATYYYTTDGSDPSPTNGVKVTGDTFNITPPDTDAASSVTAKVIAVKDGYTNSDISSVTVNFAAKDSGTGTGTGADVTVKAPTVTFSKNQTTNRDGGILALISGRVDGYKYYYTTDGTDPSPTNGTELTTSYVNLVAPDTDNESNIIFNIVAVKDGVAGSIQTGAINYGKYESNKVHVSFRDRTYGEVGTADIEKGASADDEAQALIDSGKLDIDGYTFLGWSESLSSVGSNLTVRALYEKNETVQSPAQTASYYIVNNGSSGDSHVIVGGAKAGSTIKVYNSATAEDPIATGTADDNGEADIILTLPDDGGDVYVDIIAPTSAFSAMRMREGFEGLSFASTPRAKVSYPSRAVSQTYSLPILASRLKMMSGTQLEVRGILKGEVVKVYDKDNKLIGNMKQSSDSTPMNITLSKDMSEETIYVSRTTDGLLESQQTELNKAVIADQLSTTNQTVANAKLLIESAIKNLEVNNETTQADFDSIVTSSIINSNISGTVSGFKVTPSEKDVDGSIVGTIDLVDSGTSDTASISINKTIQKLSELQTQESAKELIDDALSKLDLSNGLTKDQVLTAITAGITDKSISVTIPTYNVTEATTEKAGKISMEIVITQKGHSDLVENPELVIPQLKGNAQTNDEAKTATEEAIKDIKGYNSITEEAIKNTVADSITDKDITVDVTGFKVDGATVDKEGTITGTVVLMRTSDGSKVEVPISISIDKLPNTAQTLPQVKEALKDVVDEIDIKNDTTADEVQTELQKGITNPDVVIDISDYVITPSTETTTGSAVWTVTATDTKTGEKSIWEFIKEILKSIVNGGTNEPTKDGDNTGKNNSTTGSAVEVTTGSAVEVNQKSQDAMDNNSMFIGTYEPTNSITKDKLKDKIESVIDDKSLNITITNYKLDKSTTNKKGKLSFTVTIKDKDGNVVTKDFSIDVKKETKSSGSSSHHSSGGGSSHSSSTSNSTTTTSTISQDSLNTVGNEDTAKAITTIAGEGTKMGETKCYTNADGSVTKVTYIEKDGKYVGSFIRTGASGGAGGSVGVSSAGTIQKLYKYLPEISKFVEVPTGLQVGETAVTFDYDANTTYYVSVAPITENLVNQGWNNIDGHDYKVEGLGLKTGWVLENNQWKYVNPVHFYKQTGWVFVNSKWYFMDENGVMQTGWKLDNGHWYFLDTSNGDMSMGWKELGQTWYHLEQNGAMTTGWRNVNEKWYFFNADGSMVKDTTIDGYELGHDGALK